MASTSRTKQRANRRRSEPARIDRRVRNSRWARPAKVRMGILLWALGVPIPIILLYLLLRGCA
jgi:hypothetical protein